MTHVLQQALSQYVVGKYCKIIGQALSLPSTTQIVLAIEEINQNKPDFFLRDAKKRG